MMIPHLSTAAIGAPITRLGVSFFPIYLPANELPEISTGPSSELDVRELEDAAVGSLLAVNPTDTPVLIVEGEHFLGGKQNRAVNITVLVPPRTELPIPVSCLEEGRLGNAPCPTTATRRTRRRESEEGVKRAFVSSMGRQSQSRPRRSRSAVWRRGPSRGTAIARGVLRHRRQPPTAPSMSIVTIRDRAEAAQELVPILGRFLGNAASPSPMDRG